LVLYCDNCVDSFLDLLEVIPDTDVDVGPLFDFEESVTSIDTIDSYIEDLNSAENCHVLAQDYDTFMTNGRAFVRRLPVIIQIVMQLPADEVIYAPCDGIGVVALACHFLNRKCVTFEHYGVGKRAFDLGLIQHSVDYQTALTLIPDKSIVILSNIARYEDLSSAISRFRCVVLDEQLTYAGFSNLKLVPYTGNRLRCHNSLAIENVMCGPIIPLTFDRFLDKSVDYVTNDSKLLVTLPEFGYKILATPRCRVAKEIGVGHGTYVCRIAEVAVPPSTFVVDYRKYANAPCGRFGQRRLIERDWFPFNLGEYVVPIDRGFIKIADSYYKSKYILYGYEIPDRDSFSIKLRFNPSKLRFAYISGLLVRIVVSNVRFKQSMFFATCRRFYERFAEADNEV
jgi:hypothetical protein